MADPAGCLQTCGWHGLADCPLCRERAGAGRRQALRSPVVDAATEHLCGHRACDNEKHRQRALALVVDVLDAHLSDDASRVPWEPRADGTHPEREAWDGAASDDARSRSS